MTDDHVITDAQIQAAKECIAVAKGLIATGQNEQRIRDSFTSRLRGLFARKPTWIEEHVLGGEAALKTHKKSKVTTGFVDNLVGLTAIEYEGNLKNVAKFEEGYGQVEKYCASLLNDGNDPTQVIGVLSDTLRWHAYSVKEVRNSEGGPIEAEHVVLGEIERIDVSGGSDNDAKRLITFLKKYLQRLGSRPLRAEAIARDLGFYSSFCKRHIGGFTAVVDQAFKDNPGYARLIAELWCNFVSYVSAKGQSSAFDRTEYSNELYILTLAKLICANALADRALQSPDDEVIAILNGEFFSGRGLVNFVEYDYFGWINSSAPYLKGLIPIARGLQDDLRAYDFTKAPSEDIFGHLMAQLASRSQRLLLGQEWTPAWLARAIVAKTIADLPAGTPPRFVDMCCGSGSMIVETVLQAKKRIDAQGGGGKKGDKRIALLAAAITGFDIDPLAVMLSKVGWVLAARDWLGAPGTYQVSIPIYHADSLFAMTPLSKSIQQESDELTLQIAEHQVALPRFLVSYPWQAAFDYALDRAYALATGVKNLRLSDKDAADIANEAMNDAPPKATKDDEKVLARFIKVLTERIHQLHREGRNGIWIFILRNSYRPGLVSGQFNGLVSNPPWLALSKIADNPYKEALEELGGALNVKPEGPSFLHLEMATIFLLHAVDRYLQSGAVIGCVVPETVLNGHQHNPFRENGYTKGERRVEFAVSNIWKVHESAFKNRAAVLFGRKLNPAKLRPNPIPGGTILPDGTVVSGKFKRVTMGPRTVWTDTDGKASAADFHPADFEQGADIMPRRLFFHEVSPVGNSGLSKLVPIDVDSPVYFLVNDAKQCKDFALVSPCVVQDEFLFDILISKLMSPFIMASPVKAFLPIRHGTSGNWERWTDQELLVKAKYRAVQKAFESIAGEVAKMKAGAAKADHAERIWERINFRNKVGKQVIPSNGYLVFTGAGGSDICSAFIDLGRIPAEKLIVDQTLYWAHVESRGAALYLTGLFNSEAANQLIKAFQPRGQQGERHIHELAFGITPPFDPSRPEHVEVVKATARLMSEYDKARQFAMKKGDDGVLQWLDPGKDLAKRRSRLRGIIRELPGYRDYENACRAVYGV